jgi:hypothetical protein
MDYKLNITSISPTWPCSKHLFCVTVDKMGYPWEDHYKYVESQLTKIFGCCEYFWNDTFLCGLK